MNLTDKRRENALFVSGALPPTLFGLVQTNVSLFVWLVQLIWAGVISVYGTMVLQKHLSNQATRVVALVLVCFMELHFLHHTLVTSKSPQIYFVTRTIGYTVKRIAS